MTSYELPSLDLKGSPPAFGHPMLKYFGFDPKYINLNHGSYGSLPTPVSDFCQKVSRQIESNPDKFVRLDLVHAMRTVRERVASFVGAETDEVVLVPNASHGVNTVLRNFEWHKHDIIVGASTTYDAIGRVINYLHDIPPHPSVSLFKIAFPTTRATIIEEFRAHIRLLRAQVDSHQKNITDGRKLKIVAVIDGLISTPGVSLPWKEMTQICREEGVWSVIDAAHAIGQEVDINLASVGPDFWVSNCHKWLFAKRGCAVLYVPKRNQHIIKSTFPTSASYHSQDNSEPSNFVEMFGWNGTVDHAPYLSINAALDFRAWLGGEHKINAYCHNLALAGGALLAKSFGTRLLDDSFTGEMTLNMVNVALPLSPEVPDTPMNRTVLHYKLLVEGKVSAPCFTHNGRWWARASSQIWNELSDFEHLARVLKKACHELEDNYGVNSSSARSKL
ncbi:PLP-dependent transferase [Amylostereum chailletii]|nr:PLP-dependent transferase [Amylostereum chailletii]